MSDGGQSDPPSGVPGDARSPWAVLNRPAIWLILAYKATLSPFLGQ